MKIIEVRNMSFKYKVLGQVRYGSELEDILTMKGISNIPEFLNPSKKCIENELLFDNIERARDVFVKHVANNDIISIVVDCDCDGYTSAAVIYQYIKQINSKCEIVYYIHEHKIHGLKDVVDDIKQDNSTLVIIPDAASSDKIECDTLVECGKNVIILDHHNTTVANNSAIVVNNQVSKKIRNKSLTGVGIVYKFIRLLDKYYNKHYSDQYLDLVAVGTIGDSANLLELETRKLVLDGLNLVAKKQNKNKFITELVSAQSYMMNNQITINNIAFYICPLINSQIRLGSYESKCLLFEAMCDIKKLKERKNKNGRIDFISLQEYMAKECLITNRRQKREAEESVEKISEEIEMFQLNKYPILVCNAKDMVTDGLIGLVANRLAYKYKRPCLLLQERDGLCKGSGRGCKTSQIENLYTWCRNTNLFEKVEGHNYAFGCEIKLSNTSELYQLLSEMECERLPMYYVYAEYDAKVIHAQIIKRIAKYNYIWGSSVTEPFFVIKNIICNKFDLQLKGARNNIIEFIYKNIKFTYFTRGSSLSGVYKSLQDMPGNSISFDIVGRFSVDKRHNNLAEVIIEDWDFRYSYEKSLFGN